MVADACKAIHQQVVQCSTDHRMLCNATLPRVTDGPTAKLLASRTTTYVIGLPKTGTTSLHKALRRIGIRSCHTNVPDGNLADLATYAVSPRLGNTRFHETVGKCEAVADVPWYFLAPILMASQPDARFILTTWASGCARWFEHFSSLYYWAQRFPHASNWNRTGVTSWHECVFGPRVLNSPQASSRTLSSAALTSGGFGRWRRNLDVPC